GVCTVWPPLPSSAANSRTPSVSPCTWWNSTTSAIGPPSVDAGKARTLTSQSEHRAAFPARPGPNHGAASLVRDTTRYCHGATTILPIRPGGRPDHDRRARLGVLLPQGSAEPAGEGALV